MKRLPYLAQDKANHVVYGLALGLVGAIGAALSGVPPALGAVALAAGAGAAKELYDHVSGKGCAEAADALATVAGGVAIGVATLL